LFWSADKRFLDQFKEGDIRTKFKAFSKYPPVFKDMTFWITPEFTENNLAEIVRGAGVLLCLTIQLAAIRV
jgi:phenylalanyl-tRNA synthetase alpha chain